MTTVTRHTITFHVTNFGRYSGEIAMFADHEGYVTIAVDNELDTGGMTDAELRDIRADEAYRRIDRAAAGVELAERRLAAWRRG
jgi:hypothetical protein